MRPISLCRGLVGEIQGYSTEDGPGIRTTVFLMGCPLRCRWCSNPEFLKPEPVQLNFSGKIRTAGRWMSPEELTASLLRDKVFYEESGGGVTFSGGEAGMQTEFVCQCMTLLHQEGVHVCLDTSGCVKSADFSRLLQQTDLVLYDLKAADPALHEELTGLGNAAILANLALLGQSRVPWRLRLVLVPGCNDSRDDIRKRLELAAAQQNAPMEVDVLLYHELGRGKYKALGRAYPLESVPSFDPGLENWIRCECRRLGLSLGRYR